MFHKNEMLCSLPGLNRRPFVNKTKTLDQLS